MSLIFSFAISAFIIMFSAEKPGTQVVLLDNAGKQNAIVVTTEGGSVTIDTPYEGTNLASAESAPAAPEKVSKTTLQEQHSDTFEIAPPEPTTYMFYFKYDSPDLTPQSQQTLAAALATVSSCSGCAVDIIGYTDRAGGENYNMELSKRRADTVKRLLVANNVDAHKLNTRSYGEELPLIPTPDGIAEPKNRRAELIIR